MGLKSQPQLTKLLVRQVVLYFERAPDEWLTTGDIAVKFREDQAMVPGILAGAVRRGWISRTSGNKGGRGCQSTYSRGASPPDTTGWRQHGGLRKGEAPSAGRHSGLQFAGAAGTSTQGTAEPQCGASVSAPRPSP